MSSFREIKCFRFLKNYFLSVRIIIWFLCHGKGYLPNPSPASVQKVGLLLFLLLFCIFWGSISLIFFFQPAQAFPASLQQAGLLCETTLTVAEQAAWNRWASGLLKAFWTRPNCTVYERTCYLNIYLRPGRFSAPGYSAGFLQIPQQHCTEVL